MGLHIPEHEYEPVVVDVSYNPWGYQVVTISPWPGGRVAITLTIAGLTEAEAQVTALEHWESIKDLILKGRA